MGPWVKISAGWYQTLRPQLEALTHPVDHHAGAVRLAGADGSAGLDVEDDRVVGVDQKDRFAETILLLE